MSGHTGSSAPTASVKHVSLDDRYDLGQTRVFTSGTQALVRLCLMQAARDRAAGLNTAGYVTGYRGSPVGGLDQQFSRAKPFLDKAQVLFQPGLNEDLAATAVWGSQQAEMRGTGKYDGVFALWYGKGPGVDRSGDVFRHANFAGTSKHGGVLVLMGDDHTAESSTTAHQSDFNLVDVMMPVLAPAGVQELLDYGQHGIALSRFAGVWVGLKCLKDTVESTASIDSSIDRVEIVIPQGVVMPEGGLNIRPNDQILAQEARLHDYKREAAVAYLAANKLDRLVFSGGKSAKVGIITVGKSYLDVRQALDDLGIDEVKAADMGLRLCKVAAPWPIVPRTVHEFAEGLEMIIVVEEKRGLVEVQVREEMYGRDHAPILVGKRDERGDWLFPAKAALDPNDIALKIGERLLRYASDPDVEQRLARLKQTEARRAEQKDVAVRIPYFCSGCPHNSSTKVPAGHRSYAGIGCHYMVQWMDRGTEGFTQMGGEGANWIGEAPFSTVSHVFQNLGDGTYNHSGALAIRAAKAAGVNITYKILYNDAVAMTGGQRHEGGLKVWDIARQVAAEGAVRIALVSDEPDKYPAGTPWPAGVSFHHRDDLELVQRELATIKGLSILIFDQTCAAEKRRRRKRGEFPDPDKRVIINELVCEGCGDCGKQSNCVSVMPLETEFGRKRAIDQSNCNKDFSCVKGFCPSFVTVHGARPKKAVAIAGGDDGWGDLPAPQLPALTGSYGILVTGIGGTGVVTIGQIIGMAAHVEGKGCGVIDMAGLAQKGGAVYVHVRIAQTPDQIRSIRVPAGGARLVLGGDLVVTGSAKVLSAIAPGDSVVLVNTNEATTGEFTRNADFTLPTQKLKRTIEQETMGAARFMPATQWATALFGNSIATNMFLLGAAWQAGGIPLEEASLLEAISLNGEAVAMNKAAFAWGRRAVADPQRVADYVEARRVKLVGEQISGSLDEVIARRVAFLTDYQNAAYAARYRAQALRASALSPELGDVVARQLFRLMAIKDEYEVARLYTDGSFARQLAGAFESYERLEYHLAPPALGRHDKATGLPVKSSFGGWVVPLFRVLAKMKAVRGTVLDVFGMTAERRMERELLQRYEADLELVFGRYGMQPDAMLELAKWPEGVRGYGHVKEANVQAALAVREAGLGASTASELPQAAE